VLAQPPVTDAIHYHLMDREYCSAWSASPGLSLVGHPEADLFEDLINALPSPPRA
jgi:hypothetical protein